MRLRVHCELAGNEWPVRGGRCERQTELLGMAEILCLRRGEYNVYGFRSYRSADAVYQNISRNA